MQIGGAALVTTQKDSKNHAPTIVLTGGGSGGHITPILAVAYEIKKQQPNAQTIYIGERGGKFADMANNHGAIDKSYTVFAGKYRRYYGESWLKRITDIHTIAKNARDVIFVVLGIFQAWWLLGRLKPSVVFLKGGFVGVPIGVAAALRRIPIITHDSDAVPGLANRVISRWVNLHATALPAETYAYPRQRTKQVGVLVEHTYQPITPSLQANYRKQLKLPADGQVVLVTGGSSGASAINSAMSKIVINLLSEFPQLSVVHQVGKGKARDFAGVSHPRLHLLEFLKPMYVYMGASDVVVTRGSANTLAELGVQGKAAIVIPSPYLADGHQLRNAEYLEGRGAALIIQENEPPEALHKAIKQLLNYPDKRRELSHKLQRLSPADAAESLSKLIIEQINKAEKIRES